IGCGPVGIMTIIGAIDLGAEKIFAIDTLETRLEMAAKYGATPVNALKANPIMVIKEATEGRGADGVMEAVGNAATAKLAYDLVRAGGIISMVGVCNDEHMSFSPAQAYNKNLTFKVGRCPARYLMDKVLPIVESRRYNFTDVVTHRMPLVEGAQGYNLFANQKESCLKIILSR
ncbi:MAG: zinc-binding dehydrogenase, partial [Bacteroidota bacterium]